MKIEYDLMFAERANHQILSINKHLERFISRELSCDGVKYTDVTWTVNSNEPQIR